MDLGKQKKLAARTLGISPKRVKFVANSADARRNLQEIISRDSVRDLVADGTIKKLAVKGNSRTRANKIAEQKKKGRRQGQGSRKGTAKARFNTKEKWMIKIRALRALLKTFKTEGRLDTKTHRDLYQKAGGNFFRNKRHMMLYIEQNNLLGEVKNEK